MKTILPALKFIFSVQYRKQHWQKELEWNECRIKTILEEIASIQKILPGAPVSLQEGLKWDYSLLESYEKSAIALRKKLGIVKKTEEENHE